MGIYDELIEKAIIKQPVIKAKKKLKKQYLFGCISNGDALIRLDEEYGIKVIAVDNNFVNLILVDYGKEIKMEKQGWKKTKSVKKEAKRIEIVESTEKEDLF